MKTALFGNYDHPHYKYVNNESEADALGWVFVNERNMVKFPFKFPDLKSDEIRANVLYTGLCHSDSAMARSEWDKPIYPLCPGHEIVCEISQIGSNVKNFKVGERVAFGVV